MWNETAPHIALCSLGRGLSFLRTNSSFFIDRWRELSPKVLLVIFCRCTLRESLEAVEVDLVGPPQGGFEVFVWKARRGEPGRKGTLRHVD